MHISTRWVSSALVVIGISLAAAPAFARPWETTVIGGLDGGSARAEAINGSGQVTGDSRLGGIPHAFVFNRGTGSTDLGTFGGDYSFGLDINASGQVLGSFGGAGLEGNRAFITGPNGVGMTDLGALNASRFNDAGRVVGRDNADRLFITGANGAGVTDLGDFGNAFGWRASINNANQIAAFSYDDDGHARSFITGAGGVGRTDLGLAPGWSDTSAFAINDHGQVVGAVHDQANAHGQAFITGADGRGLFPLFGLDTLRSVALDINDKGFVVGQYEAADSTMRAFMTGPHGLLMFDLSAHVDLPDGVYLRSATGINDSEQIVAFGSDGNSYLIAAPLPEPESVGMMVLGLGVLGAAVRRRRAHPPA